MADERDTSETFSFSLQSEDTTNSAGESGAVAASGPEGANEPQQLGAVLSAVLRMIRARSHYLVGMALALKYPTEEAFLDFLASPDFTDAMEAFASVRHDILLEGALKGDPAELEAAISAHSTRAAESLEVLAELLGLTPQDIVSLLIE